MSLPFLIDGVSTVIPGVYDTFRVANSLPAPAPAGRSILILGEAEEGVPGKDLDLRLNFFTDFQSVKDFYKSGPIVDAARQIFTNQPSPVFSGTVQRLYIYKTNDSTRAMRNISSPANYGKLVSARYGERGNQIKTQIKDGQAESKPSIKFAYLPSPAARSLKLSVNGAVSTVNLSAGDRANDLVSALGAITGLTVTGGTAVATPISGAMTADVTASDDILTIARSSGTETFDSSIKVGDSLYIEPGLQVSGTSDENAGAYIITAISATSLSAKRIKKVSASSEINSGLLASLTGITVNPADLKINAPVTVSVSASTPTGAGASLEIAEASADKLIGGLLYQDSAFINILTDSTASISKISVSVPAAGQMRISLSSGSWSSIPAVGDIIYVPVDSIIAGSTKKNAGLAMVVASSHNSITAQKLFAGETTEAVAQVNLSGNTGPLKAAVSSLSSSVAAKKIVSAAERKVKLEASRASDGQTMPSYMIGGNIALEMSYWNAAATAATVSIDDQRIMTINLTGTGLNDIIVNTKKYQTLQELVDFLNTQPGLSARIPDNMLKSISPSKLDMVTGVGILGAHSGSAYNGRIKKDYADWKQFFEDNSGFVAFGEGTMLLKSGLPSADSLPVFLSGAKTGSTSNASIQAGLDAGLKVSVRNVIPLFSRDAYKDIADGLTDIDSTYTIDAINAAVKAHVATASSTLFKKERFGVISYDGSFAEAIQKVSEISYERCQMVFERHNAIDGDGNLKKFLPWMAACAVAAGRSQATLGTSLLRKPLNLGSAEHTGEDSLYSDSLVQDFDPDDRGMLERAIAAGLLVLRAVPGFGVRVESPDLSTRSRDNDPQGWVYERVNVLFTCDEVRDTMRNVLEAYIGSRTSDVPASVIANALNDVIKVFAVGTGNGALLSGEVLSVKSIGNAYKAQVKITPVEAIEAIILDVEATRSV